MENNKSFFYYNNYTSLFSFNNWKYNWILFNSLPYTNYDKYILKFDYLNCVNYSYFILI